MFERDIIEPEKSIALRASAGSGKTFNLSLRVVNLLLKGAEPDKILCITFTNKAANEMYERIMEMLRYLSLELNPSNIRAEAECLLGSEIGNPDAVEGLRQRANEINRNVIRNISRLKVSTIDSFLNSILRLFPFEAGLMPDFRLITEEMDDNLYAQAFDIFIEALSSDDKTKKLIQDIIILSGSALNSPSDFLNDYFKRLLSMRTEIDHIQGSCRSSEIWDDLDEVRMLESAAKNTARQFSSIMQARYPGLGKNAVNELIKYETYPIKEITGLTSFSKKEHKDYRYFPDERNEEIQAVFDDLKAKTSDFLIRKNRIFQDSLLYLFYRFLGYLDDAKRELNGLTFSDVTNRCYKLLVSNNLIKDSPDYFYFRLDSRIEHLLIDEFQDTNFTQWQILKPIVDELISGIGQKDRQGSFFYVGDPKQSIYRFRGGESRLFDSIVRQYKGRILSRSLNDNYRSAKNIVRFINEVFTRIGMQYDFTYEAQDAMIDGVDGYVEVMFFDRKRFKDVEFKKKLVVEHIQRLIDCGIEAKDITILCNKNDECDSYASYLIKNGINAVTESADTFLNATPVRAMVNLLRYLADTGQKVYFLSFMSLTEYVETTDIEEKIQRISNYANLVPVSKLLAIIVEEFDLLRRFSFDPNLQLLIECSTSNELEDPVSINEFLSFAETNLRAVKSLRINPAYPHFNKGGIHKGAVSIMTIHKSKGLEFPYVIIPEMEVTMSLDARLTPIIFEYDDNLFVKNIYINERRDILEINPQLKEAYRLEQELIVRDSLNRLYVAMTRAKHGLFIIAGHSDGNSGKLLSDVLLNIFKEEHLVYGEIPRLTKQGREDKAETPLLQSLRSIWSLKDAKPIIEEEEKKDEEITSFEDYQHRLFGEAFHYAVQVIKGFEQGNVEDAVKLVKQRFGGLTSIPHHSPLLNVGLEDLKARLSMLIGNAVFRDIVNGAELIRETTFLKSLKDYRIDLIALKDNTAQVIDFKTNYDKASLNKYKNQIRNYCRLVSDATGKKAYGYLIFILDDRVEIQEVK